MANEAVRPSDESDSITDLDRHQRLCTAVPFPQDLVWDGCDLTKDSRQRLYRFAQDLALSAIDWYNKKRRSKKNISKSIRYSSYGFFIVGAALPLTKIFVPVIESFGVSVGNINEVSAELALGLLGIAGGLHLIDRLVGASSGWMRYTAAAMNIQQKLLNFQFAWNELLGPKAQLPPSVDIPANAAPQPPESEPKCSPDNAVSEKGRAITLFELARGFCDDVVNSVSDETEKWASEFSDSLGHFEKELPGNSLLRRKAG